MSNRPKDRQKGMDTLFPKADAHSCRVCNEYVEDGRRNYCCPRCKRIAKAVQRMFVWDCVREAVLERDDYTCQQCGLSKEQAERAYWQTHDLAKERSDSTDEFWRRWRAYGVTEFQIFEVDHIERVADGGHPFEESNLQTLCEHCHRDKTAAENRTGEPSIEERPEPGSTPTWTPRPTAGRRTDEHRRASVRPVGFANRATANAGRHGGATCRVKHPSRVRGRARPANPVGQKTATIRLDLDSRIQLGRSVTFVDSERERFATAVVDDRGYERLAVLARQGVPGHKQYEQPADLVAEMHEYYPDRRVTGDTLADVLYWERESLWE